MTRTSTDQFRRSFAWLVAVLLVLCAVFVALGYLQGPKLTDAQVDTQTVTARSGQQLRLFANQPVAAVAADQVTVTPDARVSVTTDGDVIAVQFDQPLHYATDYVVRVEGVHSISLPQTSTLEYRFTTSAPELFWLQRVQGADDQIVRTGLTSSDATVVFASERIVEFAVVGRAIAVITVDDDDRTALQLVSLTDGAVETVPLPGPGTLSDLGASSAAFVLGVVFTPDGAQDEALGGRQLLTLDLSAGRTFVPVEGLDGAPLAVADWRFVPGGTRLVAQSSEQTLLLADAAAPGIPTPLGKFAELVGFSSDGRTMVVRDALGPIRVTLQDAAQARIEPSPVQGVTPFVGQVVPLSDGGLVEKAAVPGAAGAFTVALVVDDATAGRVLYTTPDGKGSIETFSLSPNEQFVIAEVVPDNESTVSDGYPQKPRSTSITTVIIDLASGEIVKTLEGFEAQFAG